MTPPRTLKDLHPGQEARIKSLLCTGSMRRRLLDIGLTENTPALCLHRAPGGDPSAYLIRGAVIAIRAKDAEDILIKEAPLWD